MRKRKYLLVTLAAVSAVGFSAGAARAQCAFEHPKKAAQLQSTLVQAFVSCGNPGGNTSNSVTEGGVPTCQPPETFNQQAGLPVNGWQWNEDKAQGKLTFKATKACAALQSGTTLPACVPSSPLNTGPPAAADLIIKLDLKGVVVLGACVGGANDGNACSSDAECPAGECNQGAASGTGFLSTVARTTLADRVGGDMTVVDFPASFPFNMVDGKVKLKTSADALLNSISQPGLAPCTSLEVVTVSVLDVNNNPFANMGTFLPAP